MVSDADELDVVLDSKKIVNLLRAETVDCLQDSDRKDKLLELQVGFCNNEPVVQLTALVSVVRLCHQSYAGTIAADLARNLDIPCKWAKWPRARAVVCPVRNCAEMTRRIVCWSSYSSVQKKPSEETLDSILSVFESVQTAAAQAAAENRHISMGALADARTKSVFDAQGKGGVHGFRNDGAATAVREIESPEKRLGTANAAIVSARSEKDQVDAAAAAADAQIKSLQKDLENANRKIAAAEKDMADARIEVETKKRELSQLETNFTTAKGEVESLRKELEKTGRCALRRVVASYHESDKTVLASEVNPIFREKGQPLKNPPDAEGLCRVSNTELKEMEGHVPPGCSLTNLGKRKESEALAAQILMNVRRGFVGRTASGCLTLPSRIGEAPTLRQASTNSSRLQRELVSNIPGEATASTAKLQEAWERSAPCEFARDECNVLVALKGAGKKGACVLGQVLEVRRFSKNDSELSGQTLFYTLLSDGSVDVLTEYQYQQGRQTYTEQGVRVDGKKCKRHKTTMDRQQRDMQRSLHAHEFRERARTLRSSFWGKPTGFATVVASGTAADLQKIAPAFDVQQAVSDLREHIQRHLAIHHEMGTLLDDGCRYAVTRRKQTRGTQLPEGYEPESRAFDQYHHTHENHDRQNQRKSTCRAQQNSDIRKAQALPGLGILLSAITMLHPDLDLLGVDIFRQCHVWKGATDFAWHNDIDGESNPFHRSIVRTVVIKITEGSSYFTIAGYEDTPYHESAGSWVSFCSAAQHASPVLNKGDDHYKVAVFLGYRGDDK